MSNRIKLRRSAVQNAVPTTAQIELGELALNTYDGKLYTKKNDGTASVIEIGAGGGGSSTLSGLTDTDLTTTPAVQGDVIAYNATSGKWEAAVRAVLDTAQVFTAGQAGGVVTLVDAVNIAMDCSLGNNFELLLAGNSTFDNPTNMVPGQVGSIFITQDASGSHTMAWGSYWLFPGGTVPTLSTTANAQDRIDYIIKSSTEIHAQFAGDFQ